MKFYMLVLALDTTTRQGSVSLTRDGDLVGLYTGDASVTHGARLPGELIRLLDAHALRIADVDVFAVAAGPGSFTGLRIGIATLQGLALANDRPLIGVSALDALNDAVLALSRQPSAVNPVSEAGEVAAWMDAQRGQVFSGLYSGGRVLDGPTVDTPADVLARWVREGRRSPRTFAGDGALAYAPVIREAFPGAEIVADRCPLAPSIARLAEAHMRRHGGAAPDAIQPIYVRRSDVELARDRAKS